MRFIPLSLIVLSLLLGWLFQRYRSERVRRAFRSADSNKWFWEFTYFVARCEMASSNYRWMRTRRLDLVSYATIRLVHGKEKLRELAEKNSEHSWIL